MIHELQSLSQSYKTLESKDIIHSEHKMERACCLDDPRYSAWKPYNLNYRALNPRTLHPKA